MLAVNYTNLRDNMKKYMDKVTDDYETMIITRKDNKIEVNHPLLECNETFLTKHEAVEYVEKYLINALQESCFNLRDLMRKNPDKLQIIFKFYVKSELTSNS